MDAREKAFLKVVGWIVAGWFVLLASPILIPLVIVWLVLAAIHRGLESRNDRKFTKGTDPYPLSDEWYARARQIPWDAS